MDVSECRDLGLYCDPFMDSVLAWIGLVLQCLAFVIMYYCSGIRNKSVPWT